MSMLFCKKEIIGGIPAIIWGKASERVFIHVHGKMSRKEYAENFAKAAEKYGWQTLSFDLPEHGERAEGPERCDVWQGMKDLDVIADYAFAQWKQVGLFACSLGAWFSLNAYGERHLAACLFQSPVVDMEWLVKQMMLWNGVTEERLREEQEIPTSIDLLRWDYYRYILAHPVERWPHKTGILYAGRDQLQPEQVIRSFADRFGAHVCVSPESEHPFMAAGDADLVEKWITERLSMIDQ